MSRGFDYVTLLQNKDFGQSTFYFRGSSIYKCEKTNKIFVKPILKKNIKFFGSSSLENNPYALKLQNHYVLEKLRQITYYETFISFLTLTTTKDYV